MALAAMAMRTRRIRLGTMVTPLARRRPWKVAREAVTIDHLSDGRLILGVGVGDASTDTSFTHFGEEMDARRRGPMLDEALDVLAGLWSGEPFSYEGAHFRVQEITCLPRPLQTPRIPIWIGGAYPNRGPVRRALRWDGACLYKATTVGSAGDSGEGLAPADVRTLRRLVDGRDLRPPFDIVVGAPSPFHVSDWRSADLKRRRTHIRSVSEAGATWWQEWIPVGEPATMRGAIAHGPVRSD